MFTVTVQIDENKVISVDTNGVGTLPQIQGLVPDLNPHDTPREIHTFMLDGVQYCKAKDSYWSISPYDKVHQISKSRYYKTKQRFDYVKAWLYEPSTDGGR